MLSIIPSNQFRKDLKLAKKRGLELERLTAVINTLAAQQPLDDKYRDHNLTGNYRRSLLTYRPLFFYISILS